MGEESGRQLIDTGSLGLQRPRLDLTLWEPSEERMQAFIHLFPMHGQADEELMAILISEAQPQEVRDMFLNVPDVALGAIVLAQLQPQLFVGLENLLDIDPGL